MGKLKASIRVGDLVSERLDRARILERFKIDYCCGGRKTLEEACLLKGIDPSLVIQEIEKREKDLPPADISLESLALLCDHIEVKYHEPLKETLSRLQIKIQKVYQAHGRENIKRLLGIFEKFSREISSHMKKEETSVFPMIRALEAGKEQLQGFSLSDLLSHLELEHESEGVILDSIREAAEQFVAPANACLTYRTLMADLEELERNMHEHIHMENSILFPRALKLEKK